MSRVTHGERLVALETETASQGREIGQLRSDVSENGRKADQVRSDVLEKIDQNHRELLAALRQHEKHVMAALSERDKDVDEMDTRLTKMESTGKGALTALSALFTVFGAGIAWFFDWFGDGMKGG